MIKKIKKRLAYFRSSKELSSKIINELLKIKNKSNHLVLYGSPTRNNWLGIKNATVGLFPNNSIEIPQVFSNPILRKKHQVKVCNEIIKTNFSKVTISGFANYFFDWIDLLYNFTDIEIIFHGTISEFHDIEKQYFISKLIHYGKSKKIKNFGFVKSGLDEIFRKLYNINCFHQPLNTPEVPINFNKLNLDKNKIHIGVFGNDTFNKNIHNQVINSLLIEKTIVHVLDKTKFYYLNMNDRIVGHGTNLPRNEFLALLGSMDLNLYMSFSESYGLIKYESEKLGVPCLGPFNISYLKEIKALTPPK